MPAHSIDLNGRKALVTGASRGIGRQIAIVLAEAGAQVAVHYVADEPAALETLNALAGRGHGLIQGDLRQPETAADLPDQAAQQLGGLDILVNNAGIYEMCPCSGDDFAQWRDTWDQTLAINLSGPAHIMFASIPYLQAAAGGYIVNITSRGAFRGEPEAPAYGATKAGLNSLSQSLALSLGPQGIHVVAVAPGFVETDMSRQQLQSPDGDAIRSQSPLGRVATVDEIANVVLMTVSGHADALTGGIIDVNCASYLRS